MYQAQEERKRMAAWDSLYSMNAFGFKAFILAELRDHFGHSVRLSRSTGFRFFSPLRIRIGVRLTTSGGYAVAIRGTMNSILLGHRHDTGQYDGFSDIRISAATTSIDPAMRLFYNQEQLATGFKQAST